MEAGIALKQESHGRGIAWKAWIALKRGSHERRDQLEAGARRDCLEAGIECKQGSCESRDRMKAGIVLKHR
jgi:hypothetical protein